MIRYDHEMESLHLSHALPLTQVLTPAFEPVPGLYVYIWRMRFLAGIIPIAVAIFVFYQTMHVWCYILQYGP